MNLEGGIGADFLGGGLSAGLAYYGTFKLTDDRFGDALPSLLIQGRHRVWGLGPEATLAIAVRRKVYGFVTVRYQWEFGARTTTEGAAWNILATFHYQPLHLSDMGRQLGGRPGQHPVTEDAADRLVRLPVFYQLRDADQARVIEAISAFTA